MITRNTLRADGRTVGQAIDADAAFLRTQGFNAPDGALTFDEQREAFKEKIRLAVCEAFDQATGGWKFDKKGLQDTDLPVLFPVLDSISDRLFLQQKGL